MKNLPWSTEDYTPLPESDLQPTPAPTDAQRLRVAAALATMMRDERILGRDPPGNAEAIRAILVMSPEAWSRDIKDVARVLRRAYDESDPLERFKQVVGGR
jgi:hypothetical protein